MKPTLSAWITNGTMADTNVTGGVNFNFNGKEATLESVVTLTNPDTGVKVTTKLKDLFNPSTGEFSFNPSGEVTKTFPDGSSVGVGAGLKSGDVNAFILGSYLTGDGSKADVKAWVDNMFESWKTGLSGSVSTPIGNDQTFTIGSSKSGNDGTAFTAGVSDPAKGKVVLGLTSEGVKLGLTTPEQKDPATGATGSATLALENILDDLNGRLSFSAKNALGESVTQDSLKTSFSPSGLTLPKDSGTIALPDANSPYGEGSGLKIDLGSLKKYFPVSSGSEGTDTTTDGTSAFSPGDARSLGDILKELIPSLSLFDGLSSSDGYLPPLDAGSSLDTSSSRDWSSLLDTIPSLGSGSLLDTSSSLGSGSSLDTSSSWDWGSLLDTSSSLG